MTPQGFSCPCGKQHKFSRYVHANSGKRVLHTCSCGRVHSIHRYAVRLVRAAKAKGAK